LFQSIYKKVNLNINTSCMVLQNTNFVIRNYLKFDKKPVIICSLYYYSSNGIIYINEALLSVCSNSYIRLRIRYIIIRLIVTFVRGLKTLKL